MFGRDSKLGRGVRKFYSEKGEGFRYSSDWRMLTGETGGGLTSSGRWGGIFCDWFSEHIWLSLVGPEMEGEAAGKKKKKNRAVLLFRADCYSYRGCGLASKTGCCRSLGSSSVII